MPVQRFTVYAVVLALLAVLLFNIHSWLVLSQTRNVLEAELTDRLESLAKLLAIQLSQGETVPGLNKMAAEAGLFNIFLVNENLEFIANVREPEKVGKTEPLLELDAADIFAAFSGVATSSPLYAAGPYYLKTVYVPVYERSGQVRAVLGVEADARFFKTINAHRNRLLIINGLSLVLLVVLVFTAVGIARRALHLEQTAARAGTFALLGEMAGALAHEIRNPLSTILAATERLQIRYDAGNDQTFTYIKEEVARLNRSLTNYLNLGSGKPADMAPTDLSGLVGEVLESLAPEFNRNEIRVENSLPELPPVPASKPQLRQVLMNVLLNAVQAQTQGGLIRITGVVEEKGSRRWVIIRITDHGPGIPREELKRVFEPFFTTKEKGSGLGLFVVRRVMEMHHGDVKITSAPETGTTVELRLPV